MAAAKKLKYQVVLQALDLDQKVVEEVQLSCEDYYGSSHPMIDESRYRRDHGIRLVRGSIYDGSGKLDQSFEIRYNARGTCQGVKTIHGDGTTTKG